MAVVVAAVAAAAVVEAEIGPGLAVRASLLAPCVAGLSRRGTEKLFSRAG